MTTPDATPATADSGPARRRGAAVPGLRSEARATREGGAVKGEWGGGRGPAGERGTAQ
jgi:hypothetical protein